jgi:hypothetical protein
VRVISLLTDFGLEDPYVGIMKAVILSRSPEVALVDLSHQVDPQDLTAAAFLIDAAWAWFPMHTVHVIVVDPGVGGIRGIVAMAAAGHFFLAPDNGVLTRILDRTAVEELVYVENPDFYLHPVSRTFHGRDIFAPVAAQMALGRALTDFGPQALPADLTRLDLPVPYISDSGAGPVLVGTVIAIDRFGNLVTNLDEARLRSFVPDMEAAGLSIHIGDQAIHGLSFSYQAVAPGELLAIIGSRGYLEISVNTGDASRRCGAVKGDEIRVSRSRPPGSF